MQFSAISKGLHNTVEFQKMDFSGMKDENSTADGRAERK